MSASKKTRKVWLIYSPNEAEVSEGSGGYWSNDLGWTSREGATEFAFSEILEFAGLPTCIGNDARVVHADPLKKAASNVSVA